MPQRTDGRTHARTDERTHGRPNAGMRLEMRRRDLSVIVLLYNRDGRHNERTDERTHGRPNAGMRRRDLSVIVLLLIFSSISPVNL